MENDNSYKQRSISCKWSIFIRRLLIYNKRVRYSSKTRPKAEAASQALTIPTSTNRFKNQSSQLCEITLPAWSWSCWRKFLDTLTRASSPTKSATTTWTHRAIYLFSLIFTLSHQLSIFLSSTHHVQLLMADMADHGSRFVRIWVCCGLLRVFWPQLYCRNYNMQRLPSPVKWADTRRAGYDKWRIRWDPAGFGCRNSNSDDSWRVILHGECEFFFCPNFQQYGWLSASSVCNLVVISPDMKDRPEFGAHLSAAGSAGDDVIPNSLHEPSFLSLTQVSPHGAISLDRAVSFLGRERGWMWGTV